MFLIIFFVWLVSFRCLVFDSLASQHYCLLMATASTTTTSGFPIVRSPLHHRRRCHTTSPSFLSKLILPSSRFRLSCKATDLSSSSSSPSSSSTETPPPEDNGKWVPVVPLTALPKGERRVILLNNQTILLLWYKDSIFAIENRSPAEGAYSEGLLNAKLTQDGCIVCPTTDSTFELRSGTIKDWYPNNPVLRVLTPPLRNLLVYQVKIDGDNICVRTRGGGVQSDAATEIVFSGKAQPGATATDVNVEEVRMVVDEELEGFGFTRRNEVINGKAAVIGFLLLLDFELLTGEGLLKGTGFLDFIYSVSGALQ